MSCNVLFFFPIMGLHHFAHWGPMAHSLQGAPPWGISFAPRGHHQKGLSLGYCGCIAPLGPICQHGPYMHIYVARRVGQVGYRKDIKHARSLFHFHDHDMFVLHSIRKKGFPTMPCCAVRNKPALNLSMCRLEEMIYRLTFQMVHMQCIF